MANIIPLPQNQGINVPPNSGPTYGLANSIDALFDSYQRAKVQNALLPGQVQSQDLANQGAQQQLLTQGNEYAAGHYGYSPAQIAQGFQQGSYAPPATPVDGGPQSLYASPTQAAPQGPSVNQPSPAPQQGQGQAPQMAPGQSTMPQAGPQAQSGPFGHKSPQEAAQALMQFTQAGQQLGAQTAQAGLAGKVAEANKNQGEANKSNMFLQLLTGQGGGGNAVSVLADRIMAGNEDPALGELGRGEDQAALRLGVGLELNRRGAKQDDIQAKWDAKQEAAKTKATSTAKVQGGDTQQIGTIAGVVEDTIDSAAPLIKSLNTSQIAAVNQGFLAGKKALNDPQSTALLTKLNILTNRYAVVSAYPNAPNKDQYDEARKLISDGLASGSFSAMGDAMKQEGNSIVTRAGGKGYSEPNPNPTGSVQVGKYKVTAR